MATEPERRNDLDRVDLDKDRAIPGREVERRERGEPDANRDPITGAPGAHPIGSGVGAAAGGISGGVIGAAIGAAGGPAGSMIGGAIGVAVGGIAGGLAGKGVGEAVNPTVEDEYWRSSYGSRPYVAPGSSYDRYAPAYRYGWESYTTQAPRGHTFDQAEPELSRNWSTYRGRSDLEWESARPAVRDAWDRVDTHYRAQRRDVGGISAAATGAAAAKPAATTRYTGGERDTGGGVAGAYTRATTGPMSGDIDSASDTRELLNDLVQICKDGSEGFRAAAEKVGPAHAGLFRQFAQEREQFAQELQSEVSRLGGEPKTGGDTAGALHRGWINLKAALTSGDKAIINEAERGEDAAVEAYQKALNSNPPPEVYAVIARQYTKVKAAHDRVSAIKHSMA